MIKQLLIAVLLVMIIPCITTCTTAYEYGIYETTGNKIYWENATHDADSTTYIIQHLKMRYVASCFRVHLLYQDPLEENYGAWVCATTNSYEWYSSSITASNINILNNGDEITGTWGQNTTMSYIESARTIRSHLYALGSRKILSGNTKCISNITLYIYNAGNYEIMGTDTLSASGDSYLFDIVDNFNYKLVFSDGHEYEFICAGNEVYDRDVCTYIILNFKDNCGNLLKETTGYWYTPDELWMQSFYTSSGSYDILYTSQDYLELWIGSADAELYYNISNPQETSYTILNDKIAWHNNIFVRDGNTSMIIEDALVTFSQDCIIDASSYPSRQKYSSVDGYAYFDQCELDMAYITVTATGYKPLSDSISPIHLDAFNLGQTIIAILYPVDDPTNESAMTLNGTIATTYIYFKDSNGNYTNSILDTDEYVDLYYYNNNTEDASMTLKFQKYNVYTGLEDLLSWNIPHDTSGYKRIYNTNFSDHTYSYYGYLYNVEIDGWNRRTCLSVRNETKEVIDHYQNLSTILWFENKNPQGDIDYREDISVIAYANSDNSSLLEISLELYNNSIYVDHVNLTWADFVSADTKWYYKWKPDHAYADGRNYIVRMHGYDYYLLETDYINASDFRKNKLTIIVKDRWGSNLDNAYVFLEGYGSLSTGISYYNSYEGLDNGDYRYKASKSDYSASGWDNINLTDGDEIVCYVLTSDTGNTTYVPKKFDDNEIKLIFFPLMFFLLIMILVGGFKYVYK